MLASGGYAWTVVQVEDRAAYMAAPESASVDEDIRPLRGLPQRPCALVHGAEGECMTAPFTASEDRWSIDPPPVRLHHTWMIPLITRRPSTRATPRALFGRSGDNRTNYSWLNQNSLKSMLLQN